MSADKIVTHADLPILRDLLDNGWDGGDRIQQIIRDLIAAAEADERLAAVPAEVTFDTGICRGRQSYRRAVYFRDSRGGTRRKVDVKVDRYAEQSWIRLQTWCMGEGWKTVHEETGPGSLIKNPPSPYPRKEDDELVAWTDRVVAHGWHVMKEIIG